MNVDMNIIIRVWKGIKIRVKKISLYIYMSFFFLPNEGRNERVVLSKGVFNGAKFPVRSSLPQDQLHSWCFHTMLSWENLDKGSYFGVVFSWTRIDVLSHFKVSLALGFSSVKSRSFACFFLYTPSLCWFMQMKDKLYVNVFSLHISVFFLCYTFVAICNSILAS